MSSNLHVDTLTADQLGALWLLEQMPTPRSHTAQDVLAVIHHRLSSLPLNPVHTPGNFTVDDSIVSWSRRCAALIFVFGAPPSGRWRLAFTFWHLDAASGSHPAHLQYRRLLSITTMVTPPRTTGSLARFCSHQRAVTGSMKADRQLFDRRQ